MKRSTSLVSLIGFFLCSITLAYPKSTNGKNRKTVDLSMPSFKISGSSRPDPDSSIRVQEIFIESVPYLQIQSGRAVLIIPRLDRYSAKDFEQAYCAPRGRFAEKKEVGAGISVALTENLKLYAHLVQDTYKTKCLGTQDEVRPLIPPRPELGIKFKTGNKPDDKEYKLSIQPNATVGAGMNF